MGECCNLQMVSFYSGSTPYLRLSDIIMDFKIIRDDSLFSKVEMG